MIRLVCYADSSMSISQKLCVDSSLKYGIERVYDYQPDDLGFEFTLFNKDILNQKRGCGYWLWKPYCIYRTMMLCDDGDILIYADAGIEFVNNVREITSRMDEDIFFFTNGFPHVEWCKGDVWKTILTEFLGDASAYKQVQASVIFFKVNQKTRDFVKEWLLYCQIPGFIDDSPSKLPNYPTFAEHRHDQAILTCLQIKHGYKLHFWPTNYSEHIRHTAQPEDNYPTLFNHHRKRNSEW